MDFCKISDLLDEIYRLFSDPRFSSSSVALEALQAVQNWAIEESVPVVESGK